MAVRRFYPTKDTTISNAYRSNLSDRGTNANMGASDILEVFTIFAQANSSSLETSRILLEFDTDELTEKRANSEIPESGSASFYLRLFNAPHGSTLPRTYFLDIHPLTEEWSEGDGLDMEEYVDLGSDSGSLIDGATWEYRMYDDAPLEWTVAGGTYDSGSLYEQWIEEGTESVLVDITDTVEQWLAGTLDNNGLLVKMSEEVEEETLSHYTKKFFARGSEFFFERPCLEVRWSDALEDDRGTFYASSSLAPAAYNVNSIFLYNTIRGEYKDIPNVGTGSIYVDIYDLSGSLLLEGVEGGHVTTGVYSASFALDTTASLIQDAWYKDDEAYYTGAIDVLDFATSDYNPNPKYSTNIMNMKPAYSREENARFRLFVRDEDWSPTIYTVATADRESQIIENAFYRIFRVADNYEVVPFGTGSLAYTKLSYDEEGNYFDFDMELLENGYMYGIQLAYYRNGAYHEQPETFKFRVDD